MGLGQDLRKLKLVDGLLVAVVHNPDPGFSSGKSQIVV